MNYNKVKPGDEVPCNYCGKDFIAIHYSQHYCSHDCAIDNNRYRSMEIGICVECGQEFVKKRKNNIVCPKCTKTRYNRIARDKSKERLDNRECTCIQCGAKYIRKNGRTNKYCSDRCKYIGNNNNTSKRLYKIHGSTWYSDNRIERVATCRYCKSKFKTVKLKQILCSKECSVKWKELMELFKNTHNCLYLVGYKVNNIYYIKIGVSETFIGRFKRWNTETPLLQRVYALKTFDSMDDARKHERDLHIKTIHKQTEASNEWRELNEDEMIGLLIDFGEIKGRDVNIDAEHLAQITDPGVVTS